MNIRSTALTLCLFVAVFGGNIAHAKQTTPCHDDLEKFCKDVPPGRAVNQCMKKHNAELSSACQQHMHERKQKATAFKIACGQDAKKFCKKGKQGQGGTVKCLRAHEAELSSQCKANIGGQR